MSVIKTNKVKIKKNEEQEDEYNPGDIFSIDFEGRIQYYILAQLNSTGTHLNFNFISLDRGNRFGPDYFTIDDLIKSVQKERNCVIKKVFGVGECTILIRGN